MKKKTMQEEIERILEHFQDANLGSEEARKRIAGEIIKLMGELYRFTVNGYGDCLEFCHKLNNGTRIGSIACKKECKYNLGYNNKQNYIICSKIKEATI